MKHVLSVFTFGVGALLFVAVFATLKPAAVAVASEPGEPGCCDMKASPTVPFRSSSWFESRRDHNEIDRALRLPLLERE